MEITTESKLNAGEVRQYLTFLIGADAFAVSLLKVKEIIGYSIVTHVPKMPDWVRGVINLRGSVVPVIDLALKFRQPSSAITKHTCIVIMEIESDGEQAVLGVVADSVSEVIDWSGNDIQEPPAFGTQMKTDYLLGIAASGAKFCILLDVDKILSVDELLDLPTIEEAPVDSQLTLLDATEDATEA